MPRHKRLVLDSGLRVPLLIRFPKKYRHLAPAKAGQTVDDMLSFVDFAPTILSILGLPIPEYMQGIPFLGSAVKKDESRYYVFGARDRVDEAYDLARCVRDANYLYIRNFMPHLSYNQPSFYSDQGEIRGEITSLAEQGKLANDAQRHYAGPWRPMEELYDVKKDPFQVRNLVASAEHKAIMNKMRGLLRIWMLDTRDLGLLPEIEMARRSKASSPYRIARDKFVYPLEKILDAAELVGTGKRSLPRQIELLEDTDAAVRYWAAVGLKASASDASEVIKALEKAVKDSSALVRIEAAEALCRVNRTKTGLKVLEKELGGKDLRAVLLAARALELLGKTAKPVLGAMKKALARSRKGGGDGSMFIRFALDTAIKKLK
jgi:hypothetical protein